MAERFESKRAIFLAYDDRLVVRKVGCKAFFEPKAVSRGQRRWAKGSVIPICQRKKSMSRSTGMSDVLSRLTELRHAGSVGLVRGR